jgi:hypothetical protein
MPIHIVHVEDEKVLRNILAIAFRAAEPDIQLHQFVSADEALPYVETHGQTVDLFILDIPYGGNIRLQVEMTRIGQQSSDDGGVCYTR